MENADLMRIPDEATEEGNDVVDRFDSDSSSISNSESDSDAGDHSDSDSDAGHHPDSDSNAGDHQDSDSESAKSEVISGSDSEELDLFADGPLVRVREIDEQDQFVKNNFLTVMSGSGMRTAVEAVHKNVCPGFTWQAKLKSFQEISRNMEIAGEGFGKVKLAWFGGSKDEIMNIVRYGFTSRGRGICLSPFHLPSASIHGCVADENGLYHVILCRAILGKSELLTESPEQRFPSSEEFHSAADNLAAPRVYMVWSSYMNTHVMPQYVVSFRPPVRANEGSASIRPAVQENPARANEGVVNQVRENEIAKALANEVAKSRASGEPVRMIPFLRLVEELVNVLPVNIITSLHNIYREYAEGKVTKAVMTRTLRQLAGDEVLYTAIASIRRSAASEEASPGNTNNVVSEQRKSDARSSANKVLKKLRGASD